MDAGVETFKKEDSLTRRPCRNIRDLLRRLGPRHRAIVLLVDAAPHNATGFDQRRRGSFQRSAHAIVHVRKSSTTGGPSDCSITDLLAVMRA